MTECIVCGASIKLENAEKGELISCRDCGTELEVTQSEPLKLDIAPQIEEDWGE